MGDLTRRVEALRVRRRELLDELATAWEAEHGLVFRTQPYVGDLETVATRVETDRASFDWFDDRPAAPTIPLDDEELGAIRDLQTPDVVEAAALGRSPRDVRSLLTEDAAAALAADLADLTRRRDSHAGARSRAAHASAPSDPESADQLAEVTAETARLLRTTSDGAASHVLRVLDDARTGQESQWRGVVERTDLSLLSLADALGTLGDHVVESAGVAVSTIRGAARALRDALPPGGRVKRLFNSADVKEAVANLQGVAVDGSAVDTHEEAVTALAWAEARTAFEGLRTEWRPLTDQVEDLALARAVDVVSALRDQTNDALDVVSKARAALVPVTQSGVQLADAWSPDALLEDAAALRLAATERRIGDLERQLDRFVVQIADDELGAEQLRAALLSIRDQHDPKHWHELVGQFDELNSLQARAQRAHQSLERLRQVCPGFAAGIETDPEQFMKHLGHVPDAMKWGHTVGLLAQVESRDPLLQQLASVDVEYRESMAELAAERGWMHIQELLRAQPELGRALRQYASAQSRVPRTRTARTYNARLRDAQRALALCWGAVPAWVMSIDQVAETFGDRIVEAEGGDPLFDVVIVDEASQSPLTSAFVMQLAERVAIVGDPYQTTPPSFQTHDAQEAARKQISDPDVQGLLAPNQSLWGVGSVAVQQVNLTEHFRCPPEVIGWAQEKIYREIADVNLEVLTGVDPQRPKPVIEIDATAVGADDPQADAIVEDLRALLEDPPGWLGDVGIVVRNPRRASAVQRAVFDAIDQATLEERKVRVGTPYQFQGAQRDLMYLAMSDDPPEPGRQHVTRSFDSSTVNQMNVAVSRARQQLRVVYSCSPAAYKPDDVRRSFLDYAIEADATWERRLAPGVPDLVPEHERVEPFDSLSEQRLFNELANRGYSVLPQVPAPVNGHNYRLDLVVEGPTGQVVVEYDGPHHDTAAQYLADRERQQDLERCGWTVLRVHHSEFTRGRTETADRLEQTLRDHEIFPIADWDAIRQANVVEEGLRITDVGDSDVDEAGLDQPNTSDEPIDSMDELAHDDVEVGDTSPLHEAESAVQELAEPTGDVATDASVYTEDGELVVHHGAERFGEPAYAIGERSEHTAASPVPRVQAGEDRAPAAGRRRLDPYRAFEGTTAPPLEATRSMVVEGVVEIVEAEGPIIGDRLIQVYNRASGGSRAGRNIRSRINSAITSAVRQGQLVEDNPTDQQGNKYKTFRLPEQPEVHQRELGDRTIHEVPPAELAVLVAFRRTRGLPREGCYRAILDDYGLVRLTESTRRTLDAAWDLSG